MADPVTSLKVFYSNSGKSASQTIRFKGNFGFNIDGKEFKAENGHVYDKNGKPVQGLKLPEKAAKQFIGMSNTAELAQDYTFSKKDINEAEAYFSYGSNDNTRINSILGSGVTKGIQNGYANYKDGVYSTHYNNHVSVWMNK